MEADQGSGVMITSLTWHFGVCTWSRRRTITVS